LYQFTFFLAWLMTFLALRSARSPSWSTRDLGELAERIGGGELGATGVLPGPLANLDECPPVAPSAFGELLELEGERRPAIELAFQRSLERGHDGVEVDGLLMLHGRVELVAVATVLL